MALRISVDLEGLRWADLFRFVDLARNGGIGPEDQVDVITYGSDPMSVSLSARIYPASDGFLSTEQPEIGSGEGMRGSTPLSIGSGSTGTGAGFGYDGTPERAASSNGSHYPAFDNGSERPPSAAGNLPSYGPGGYDGQQERGTPPPPPPPNGSHYPAFDGQNERMPGQNGQFAGFEPVFDRSQGGKDTGGAAGVESPYIEEFARLQEGLMRQVRRDGEVRPDRT